MKNKTQWIDEYYEKYFDDLCNSGIQGKGSSFIHNKIEKYWKNTKPFKILEVGAGDGAHFKFTRIDGAAEVQLTALDVRVPSQTISKLDLETGSLAITWVQGNVEKIPLEDETFDRVTSTCLLHHVDDPLAAMLEMRRVTAISGEISIGLPTDPGLVNRFIKKMYTYRKARKLGMENPAFVYSLDHQNHIFGLIEIAKYVFRNDDLSINYLPFKVKSANLNLLVVLKVVKK